MASAACPLVGDCIADRDRLSARRTERECGTGALQEDAASECAAVAHSAVSAGLAAAAIARAAAAAESAVSARRSEDAYATGTTADSAGSGGRSSGAAARANRDLYLRASAAAAVASDIAGITSG